MAVCLVEFRNCVQATATVPEVAPYPAGLNDCFSGLEWLNENKALLRITDGIAVAGESGGGNLCIATALKAMRAGRLGLIPSGMFAMCPYIAGDWPLGVVNEGILGESHIENYQHMPTSFAGMFYSIEAWEAKDPLSCESPQAF